MIRRGVEMKRRILPLLFTAFLAFVISGCGPGPSPTPTPAAAPPAAPETAFELTSTAFAHEEPIPQKYTCDGQDISPPLQWSDPPQGTQSLALICDDPDAPVGTWVHWVLYNLPAEARALPEAVPPQGELPDGSRHGQNSWRRLDYGGPCPPSGTHRYFFKLYALDTILDLEVGEGKKQILQAMEGHILAQAELMGVYSRQ
jgi:Raf kinase inhibitor-like YbhB/YbcL family protein